MYTMGPAEIHEIIDHLRHAERAAATLDLLKIAGLNDIEWRIGLVLNYILRAAVSPIQFEQQPGTAADPPIPEPVP